MTSRALVSPHRLTTHTYTYIYKACSDEEAKKTALSPLSPLLCIVRAIYSFCLLRIPQKYNKYILYAFLYIVVYIHIKIYMQIAIKRRPVENALHIIIFHVLCCLFNYCFLLIIYFLIYLKAFLFFRFRQRVLL